MTDKTPLGACPHCNTVPPGGFDDMDEPCQICGVARDGTDGDGNPGTVPHGINSKAEYGAVPEGEDDWTEGDN